jgi:SAM-dependent methyltransferase
VAGGARWGFKNDCPLFCCPRCGIIFTHKPASDTRLKELYDHYYDAADFSIPSTLGVSLDRLVRSCERFRRTGGWLDVGFGEGSLLTVAERHGWRCHGTELSLAALAFGERRGWVVTADAKTDTRFPQQGFDVVTMIELLEHVPLPATLLRSAYGWLRPGGLLYITTPNATSFNRMMLGPTWSVISPPEHLTIWTARGLRRALTNAGFATRQIRTEGANPCEVLARWLPWRKGAMLESRNEAGFRLNNAFSSVRCGSKVKAGINCCLTLLGVGDSLKVWAVRGRLPS